MVITPPSVFDAAVILRTLYVGLGYKGWRLAIIGLGRKPPLRLITESRTPLEVIKNNVLTELREPENPVYIVDPRGKPAKLLKPPSSLIIDYSGTFSSRLSSALRVRSLGLNSLTYEAIGVIYEYWIRASMNKAPTIQPYSRDLRSGVYLAKKCLEAVTTLDNYTLLEPSVLIYTLRKIYLEKRVIIDPALTSIRINHVEGALREEIEAPMYSARRYERVGAVRIIYSNGVLEVFDNNGLAYRVLVDVARMRACSAPGLCVSKNETEAIHGLEDFINKA